MSTQNQHSDLSALIDQFTRYDDSEHFPIREHVRDDLAQGKTVEDTAAWLEEETLKHFPSLSRNLPWIQIAQYFHEDVSELIAYEKAQSEPPSSSDEMEEEMWWSLGM